MPAPSPPAAEWKPAWADVTTAKLRPGSPIGSCTAGFLFVDPVQQTYYVGIAGHCTSSADGSTRDGTGIRITTAELGEIGTVVFDSDGPVPVDGPQIGEGGDVDFSLIQLDPAINREANPEMLSFQGPTGYLACTDLQAGDSTGFYGHGIGFRSTMQQARTGFVARCNTLDNSAKVAIPSSGGDSGGPLIQLQNGKAIGHCSGGTSPADMTAKTMDYVFRELAAAGFGNVALATIDGGFVKPPAE